MLFQKIFDIAQEATLAMTFSANREAGTLIVTVIPKAVGDNPNPALHQPLQFEATPEELENGLPEALGRYGAARRSLADAIQDAETVIAAAKKETTAKAAKAVKGASGKGGEKAAAKAPRATESVPVKVTEPPAPSGGGAGTPAVEPVKVESDNLFA